VPPVNVLLLCSANLCRSPMAAALLHRRLTAAGIPATVDSAGTGHLACLARNHVVTPPDEIRAALAGFGIDMRGHRRRDAAAADLTAADLILGMAREHVRWAAVTEPTAWPRAFTLKELVRRGTQAGPRCPGEPVSGWLARAQQGRAAAMLLGDSPDDDIADPVGGPRTGYSATATLLDQLLGRLVALCWGGESGGASLLNS